MNDEHNELKRAAALRAIEYVRDGMTVGLGTGSTSEYALRGLAEKVRGGLHVVGVPTSDRIADMARQLGVATATLEERPQIDITIDGADEIDLATFFAIKGRGGALLREKIVALSSAEEILIVDGSKVVHRLGEHDPLPVEVIAFGWGRVRKELVALGCDPQLRTKDDGAPFVTDSGNYLFDCHFPMIDDPRTLASRIKGITGVVEHGLFIDIASRIIVADPQGIRVYER